MLLAWCQQLLEVGPEHMLPESCAPGTLQEFVTAGRSSSQTLQLFEDFPLHVFPWPPLHELLDPLIHLFVYESEQVLDPVHEFAAPFAQVLESAVLHTLFPVHVLGFAAPSHV